MQRDIDAHADKLLKYWVGRSGWRGRLTRFIHFPVETMQSARFARASAKGMQPREVMTAMPWGGEFHGIVPEAVTDQLLRLRFYDTRTSVFVREHLKPGQCFVDVGAHFGYFTLLAAQIVGPSGKVIAVEPTPSTYARLGTNVERNHLGNVRTVRAAADEKAGTLTLTDFGPVYSTLNTSHNVRGDVSTHIEGKSFEAPAVRLDDEIGAQTVHMLKIDAEGHEIEALRGMQDTIARDRPMILLECGGIVGDEARAREIFAFMAERGYIANESDGRNLKRITAETKDSARNDVVFTHLSWT